MHVLVDTNVALDFLLKREPWFSESTLFWQAIDDGRLVGYVLVSAITDVYYIARRLRGPVVARAAVQSCLSTLETLDVRRSDLEDALQEPGSDFEDNVQIACAIRAGLHAIVTRDPADSRNSSIPALSPSETVQRLAN